MILTHTYKKKTYGLFLVPKGVSVTIPGRGTKSVRPEMFTTDYEVVTMFYDFTRIDENKIKFTNPWEKHIYMTLELTRDGLTVCDNFGNIDECRKYSLDDIIRFVVSESRQSLQPKEVA